jgi:16S rRNA (uracil1498-N3)-methyltransferase
LDDRIVGLLSGFYRLMDSLPYPYSSILHLEPLVPEQWIQFGAEIAQALRARQVRVSEAFTLRDSTGRYFRASLRKLGPAGGEALVYEAMAHSPESPLLLTLMCAVLARQRMLFVAQKATELGVHRILPVITQRSVQAEGLDHEKAHAWPGQVIRAYRQCRRASLPEIRPPVPLEAALADPVWAAAEQRFYLDDQASVGGSPVRGATSAALAVGPEGGWTEAERSLLEGTGADCGATPLLLGGRVLRAETAVVAGLALVQHHLGDL